jgi:DNA-binding beta-propeller fold protein YncE
MLATRFRLGAIVLLVAAGCSTGEQAPEVGSRAREIGAPPRFSEFETGQVRPLALSADGKRLYAVNTPAARLEIFDVKNSGLQLHGSVPVGLEPIAVAERNDREVWVLNHLSDSVSIVDVGPVGKARVVRTLLVGDEPRDIVFAGPGRDRAFITTAHRGQNNPNDPQLQTPSVGRADVWVFDAANLGTSLGGTPINIVTLFTDTPRALAVNADGSRVYAAGFHTGNRTSTVHETQIPDGGEAAGGLPNPRTNFLGQPQPETGMIVKYDGDHWRDVLGRVWDGVMKLTLPDKDVFAIDANANPPHEVSFYQTVGTILFNMIVNPVSGKVYVSNTDALNDVRFEGPGIFGGSTVRGHLHESRIAVLDPGGSGVTSRHLNKHIDYSTCCSATPNSENDRSLAFPQDMAISSNGQTLYVVAFGSSKVGVFDTAALENDTFVPSTANQIAVTGGGPSGLALDEARGRLYVMTRFDNAVVTVDTASKTQTARLAMYNPEPASVVVGRPFLYDAANTSSHGDSACASCHIFGDFDSLAWDLGNPDEVGIHQSNPIIENLLIPHPADDELKPMKGPMATQSLRGLPNHGPMHWRGDRTGSNDEPNAQPDSGAFNENLAFMKFIVAFEGLLGRSEALTEEEMQAFTDFQLQVMYPPNPVRNLDNSLTADQLAGRDHFFRPFTDTVLACSDCHTLDPSGNAEFGVEFPGFFGTDGKSVFETVDPVIPQAIKVPHLRNMYQKVGMFGTPPTGLFGGSPEYFGDQVRGFGYLHDGAIDSLFSFMNGIAFSDLFSPNGFPFGPAGDPARRQMTDFLLAFDSNLAPIVGQQITLRSDNEAAAGPRIDLLTARAAVGECELVVKGRVSNREAGWLYDGTGSFSPNRSGSPDVAAADLRLLAHASGGELTYTCVPPGSGRRLGIDADLDGALDGDEDAAGSDPYDPSSTP